MRREARGEKQEARSKKQEARGKKQEARGEKLEVSSTPQKLRPLPFSAPPRYEVKIPLPLHRLDEVQAWIRLHPAHWRVAYPPRQVNNIYFDTHTLAAFNANLSGIGERTKVRLRWYGEDIVHVANAHLELKRKSGMAGWKHSADMAVALDLSTQPWRVGLALLRAALPASARMWLAQYPVPVLINSYQRVYYVTPDGDVRLTVDAHLRAYPQRATLSPNLTRRARLAAQFIVELKAPVADTQRISTVLDGFPVRVDRFSKYVQGMSDLEM